MIDHFAIIIGAMKSGTTSLFRYLSEHPQICPSKEKEPHFFAMDDQWQTKMDCYEQLWNWDPAKHAIAMEASTSYTMRPDRPDVAERIKQVDRDFRFIYLMRHPLRRIESHIRHLIQTGRIPPKITRIEDMAPNIIDWTRYAMQLETYFQHFPKDRILLIAFEDLKDKPMKVVKSVCEFLGVDPSFSFAGLGKVRNPTTRKDHPLYNWATRQSPLTALAKLIPRSVKETGRRMMAKKIDGLIKLTEQQEEGILQELRDDLMRLQDYGFDISRWNIKL